jgi:hypothetical protein
MTSVDGSALQRAIDPPADPKGYEHLQGQVPTQRQPNQGHHVHHRIDQPHPMDAVEDATLQEHDRNQQNPRAAVHGSLLRLILVR